MKSSILLPSTTDTYPNGLGNCLRSSRGLRPSVSSTLTVSTKQMPYADKTKQREFARKWNANRRAAFFSNKSCVKCGSAENLELDHIVQEDKVHHCIWSWSEPRRLAELAKCQVLCHDCHARKTTADNPRHGQNSPMAKLSDSDVIDIRILSAFGVKQKVLREQFGVSKQTLSAVVNRERWKHL